jgi:hypothetical protein
METLRVESFVWIETGKSVLLLGEQKDVRFFLSLFDWAVKASKLQSSDGLVFQSIARAIYLSIYKYIFSKHHTASSTQNIPPLYFPRLVCCPLILLDIFKCNRRSCSETLALAQ